MKKWGNRTGKAAVFFLLLLTVSGAWVISKASESDGHTERIRVGFPFTEGFSERGENGGYSGYTYDYLMELSQYTGFEYEFVTMEGDINEVLTAMYDMLEKGELDLLGATSYSEQMTGRYGYAGDSYGVAHTVLYADGENMGLNEFSYLKLPVLRIAALEGSKVRVAETEKFCSMNGITPEFIYCRDEGEQKESLRTGRADVMIGRDVSPEAGLRIIAKYAPEPFFFVTWPGNTELLNKLNTGIMKLNEADPSFVVSLHQKYFENKADGLAFTEEEKEYIKTAAPLRVGVDVGKAPIQYKNSRTGEVEGIAKDLFSWLSEATGLSFELITLESQDELSERLKNGELDMASSMSYDYDLAEKDGVYLTRPYLNSQAMMAINKKLDYSKLAGKRLALSRGLNYRGPFIGIVTEYDSVEACMEAVLNGKADYCYGNSYSIQYYSSDPRYRNITLVPQSDRMLPMCIGVSRKSDLRLAGLINRAIRSMPEEKLQYIIYYNTIAAGKRSTLLALVYENPGKAILIFSFIAVLIFCILLWILYSRTKAGRKLAISNERYLQLCELSNEYLFEYDYRRERLELSDKLERRFIGTKEPLMDLIGEVRKKRSASGDFSLIQPDGQERFIRITAKAICDVRGEAVCCVGKIADIQKEEEEKERLRERARRDSLTGLYNAAVSRSFIGEQLEKQENGRPGAFIMIDIDYFKKINDLYGHYIGDCALVSLADILRETFPAAAVTGRLGGDEFVVYLPDANPEEIREKCELIRAAAKNLILDGQPLEISLSMGIVLTNREQAYDALYKKADEALYAVKKEGRDGYKIRE